MTAITEELKALWDKEQGENRTRASLFNLILYVQKNERTEHYENIVKSVVSKFPCRVIMILADESAEREYLNTTVSSQTIGEGDLQIFCEMIQIEVAGACIERVPFLILPEIMPDLPVYLLWTEDPATESAILPHLEPYADRIIFDSESTHDLQGYSQAVLALQHRFHCAIGDLNWSAIAGWRKIFAQEFESFESFVNLVQSKIIRIHYNRTIHEHTELEAAYLQAWIASRLNWKFQEIEINEGNIRLTYRRPTSTVVILLVPEEVKTLKPGTILSVEIECEKEKAHYMFKRHPQTRQVFVQFSDKDRCDLPSCTMLAGRAEGQEIIQEIFYPSTGSHYREALDVLTGIEWKR